MTSDSSPNELSPVSTDTQAQAAASDRRAVLVAQAERVRATIGSKRSDKLVRLFDFLLERTLQGRAPTELEIANEAFSIGPVIEAPQDATVRVYVHRLRKSLEQSQADMAGPRIFIPKGEYLLVLEPEAPQGEAEEQDILPAAPERPARSFRRLWWGIAAGVLLLNGAAWWLLWPRLSDEAPPALAQTTLWSPMAGGERPITLVLGDYYLFAEANGDAGASSGGRRLVRMPSINAREDLDIYLMARPEERDRVGDVDMRYVPSSVVTSLGDIYSALRTVRGAGSLKVTIIPSSQLTTDLLKSSDIIYVGLLNGLGTLLRNPLFQASGFRVGRTYDELVDVASDRSFMAEGGLVSPDERIARRDFGYIAALPGPSGNRLVVIAGARDAAVRQMAEIVKNPARLALLGGQTFNDRQGFEALYQVRALGNLNISGQLVTVRPLKSAGIWDSARPSQRFPDSDYEGEGTTVR